MPASLPRDTSGMLLKSPLLGSHVQDKSSWMFQRVGAELVLVEARVKSLSRFAG